MMEKLINKLRVMGREVVYSNGKLIVACNKEKSFWDKYIKTYAGMRKDEDYYLDESKLLDKGILVRRIRTQWHDIVCHLVDALYENEFYEGYLFYFRNHELEFSCKIENEQTLCKIKTNDLDIVFTDGTKFESDIMTFSGYELIHCVCRKFVDTFCGLLLEISLNKISNGYEIRIDDVGEDYISITIENGKITSFELVIV